MKTIGNYLSKRWGRIFVLQGTYGQADGPTAIQLNMGNGEPLAVLSVNMYKPECSQDSRDLPKDCFYVKTWSENEEIAQEAFDSGLFIFRPDFTPANSGFVQAPVWQIKEKS